MSGKINNGGKRWCDETGAALIVVLLISIILIAIAIKYMSSNDKVLEQTTDEVLRKQAEGAISVGIEYARERLKSYDEWNENGWSEVINRGTLGGNFGYVTVTFAGYDQLNKTAQLIVESDFKGRKANRTHVIKAIQAKTPYPAAVCAIENLNIGGNSIIDSFNSVSGPYSVDLVTNGGNIGSNGIITISGNSNIKGKVIAGKELHVMGNANILNNTGSAGFIYLKDKAIVRSDLSALGNLEGEMDTRVLGDVTLGGNASAMQGKVEGNVRENAAAFVSAPCDCGTYDMADLAVKASANNNNRNYLQIVDNELSLTNQESVTLTAGAYYFTELILTGNARLFMDGEVVIVLDGDGPFVFGGNVLVNANKDINSLTVYSNSEAMIKMSGDSFFAGNIYAPKATVRRLGNSEFFGSMLAKDIFIGGSSTLHYDTKLAAIGGTDVVLPGVIEMKIMEE